MNARRPPLAFSALGEHRDASIQARAALARSETPWSWATMSRFDPDPGRYVAQFQAIRAADERPGP